MIKRLKTGFGPETNTFWSLFVSLYAYLCLYWPSHLMKLYINICMSGHFWSYQRHYSHDKMLSSGSLCLHSLFSMAVDRWTSSCCLQREWRLVWLECQVFGSLPSGNWCLCIPRDSPDLVKWGFSSGQSYPFDFWVFRNSSYTFNCKYNCIALWLLWALGTFAFVDPFLH